MQYRPLRLREGRMARSLTFRRKASRQRAARERQCHAMRWPRERGPRVEVGIHVAVDDSVALTGAPTLVRHGHAVVDSVSSPRARMCTMFRRSSNGWLAAVVDQELETSPSSCVCDRVEVVDGRLWAQSNRGACRGCQVNARATLPSGPLIDHSPALRRVESRSAAGRCVQ